ncbi:alanine racemase [Chryseomicrobium aureum]|uniref:alanine racemase n=1 Tax=Chryseomicrobium aureum TaxID=1441723 RepID=UPI00370D4B87
MTHYRPTYLEIDLDAISTNIATLKNQLNEETMIIPVVKANAYGHGAVRVVQHIEAQGLQFFAVATPDEAVELKEAGSQSEILVLGNSPHSFIPYAERHRIHLTAHSLEWIQNIPTTASPFLHIKLDTGMGRIGLQSEQELKKALRVIAQHKNWRIEGVYTHFATADEAINPHFEQQLKKFEKWLALFPERPRLVHAANSAAAIQHGGAAFSAVRFGISMYGIAASDWMKENRPFVYTPAMRLVSELVHVKQVEVGTSIGYGAYYTSAEPEWIGTLPIGYADGLLRGLKGLSVLIEDTVAPIVGKICMDQTMIKLPKEFKVGTKVVLLGSNGVHTIPAEEWAEYLRTIPYEICCQLSYRVPRIYPQSDK